MAEIQKYFEQYHLTIRVDYDMDSRLADSRDIILKKIEESLRANGHPTFLRLLQGSYRMKTGVKPLRGHEHDIDVGLRFKFTTSEYDAATARAWILEAVKNHTKNVEEKGPCIRVRYADGYHVDLIAYAWEERDGIPDLYHLAHRERGWVPADPPTLLKHVMDAVKAFDGTEDATTIDQLRRVIRYLKRWDDIAVADDVAGKVSGLAYTLFAIAHLSPAKSFDAKPDDRTSLERLADIAARSVRIQARKPTPEYEDMFGHLTVTQMTELKSRFEKLLNTLRTARLEVDPRAACQLLAAELGDDFPVPDSSEMAVKTSAPAILTSSKSA